MEDYLVPILGSVTGVKMAQWKVIFFFSLKVFLFCVPFIVLGLLIEHDVIRVPVKNRVIKICVALLFATPVFLFGLFNFIAPRLPDAFWATHSTLEQFWIMEGKWSPLVLMAIVILFVLLYLLETIGGELTK
ncbi:MAG TPA: hypothetical protein ENH32_08120 [Proteobacteria bacterium]|nr:hypothetical protein BMS3Abin14_01785 [bacterium BMS3Abin14]HDL53926.1 hypothetical protein [Pseudomonadota bacterium]